MADVFVGFFFDENREAQLLATSKKGVSIAPNQYQKGLLTGLGKKMEILSATAIGSYPNQNSRLVFKEEHVQVSEGNITYLPFLNLYLIRDWMFQLQIYLRLKKTIERQAHTTVYVYSINLPFLKAVRKLKKQYADKMHVCLIIPDLAGKYGLVRKGLKGIKDRLDANKKMELSNCADSFVFLTEDMKKLFAPKPYVVIEGFLPQCEFCYTNRRIPKTVLYTGSLNRAFSIDTLLEAFAMLPDPDARLWICGAGDLEKQVQAAAKSDSRIEYKGFLPKKEISQLQTQCDVLVNPRTDEGEYTKYSFPSKTMEYLLSGSKVVMHRLPGIPEEYCRFIRTPAGKDAGAMADALREAWADTDFYNGKSSEQIAWMRRNKQAKSQIEKLTKMLGEL